ncbi:hypothetical protein CJ030_MR1G012139 [Morella rubra]|uniref:RNase H type-1 domain-containing protein n=1 Tax=Morella rubra TaxID=262757 RepID=A0A6A1WNC3_9ROSI|nr:hypothetical protein CJ030_MR1G012139 [Morella rubra]
MSALALLGSWSVRRVGLSWSAGSEGSGERQTATEDGKKGGVVAENFALQSRVIGNSKLDGVKPVLEGFLQKGTKLPSIQKEDTRWDLGLGVDTNGLPKISRLVITINDLEESRQDLVFSQCGIVLDNKPSNVEGESEADLGWTNGLEMRPSSGDGLLGQAQQVNLSALAQGRKKVRLKQSSGNSEVVKVNVDVVVRDEFTVVATIIQDHLSVVKGSTFLKIKIKKGSTFLKIEVLQPLEGEALATKLGVEFVQQMGFKDAILEGDSELVMKAINRFPACSEWRIHHIVLDIVDVCRQMKSWKALHVPRGANEVVHHLARWAAAEFSLGGNPRSCEHFLDLPWMYAGTDPLNICLLCGLLE